MKPSPIIKSILSVGGITVLVKLLGFFKQIVVASTFGATLETDYINLSYGLIGNTQYLLVQVLLTGLVSVYISVKQESEREARVFSGDVLKTATFLAGIISLVLFLLATPVAHLLAPGYSWEEIGRLAWYIRLFSPMLLCFSWMGVSHALLNANRRFLSGQMEGIYQSAILIALSLFAASVLGADALTLGYWMYAVVTALILLSQARGYVSLTPSNPFRSPHVKRLMAMIGPLLIGYGAVYINQIVDKMLVSGLETGTVTAMSYAAVLSNLLGTLICSVASVLYTHMAQLISGGKEASAVSLAERSVQMMTLLLLPVTVITVCQAEDVVALVYGYGVFGQREVALTALALAGYGFTFIPQAWQEVYSKIQYSYGNSKAPTRNSVIGIAVNIVLSVSLCPVLGVFGVALASSVAALVIGALNMITARAHAAQISYRWLLQFLPYLGLGGASAVVLCYGSQMWFAGSPVLIRLLLSTVLVFGVYGIIIFPLLWKLGLRNISKKTG